MFLEIRDFQKIRFHSNIFHEEKNHTVKSYCFLLDTILSIFANNIFAHIEKLKLINFQNFITHNCCCVSSLVAIFVLFWYTYNLTDVTVKKIRLIIIMAAIG